MFNPWPPDQVASALEYSTQSDQYDEAYYQSLYSDLYLADLWINPQSSSLLNWDGAASTPAPAAVSGPSRGKHFITFEKLNAR